MNEIELGPMFSEDQPQTNEIISNAIIDLQSEGFKINSISQEVFRDENLSDALAEKLPEKEIKEVIINSSKFRDFMSTAESGRILGEEVTIPESLMDSGRIRRSETGNRVLFDVIEREGIDPGEVLMFRVTQPSPTPKPEYYWTSDYFEVIRGLHAEISVENRSNSVILVSNLEDINNNDGLMVDIDGESGLTVRQIGFEPFDQKNCLAVITSEV